MYAVFNNVVVCDTFYLFCNEYSAKKVFVSLDIHCTFAPELSEFFQTYTYHQGAKVNILTFSRENNYASGGRVFFPYFPFPEDVILNVYFFWPI